MKRMKAVLSGRPDRYGPAKREKAECPSFSIQSHRSNQFIPLQCNIETDPKWPDGHIIQWPPWYAHY